MEKELYSLDRMKRFDSIVKENIAKIDIELGARLSSIVSLLAKENFDVNYDKSKGILFISTHNEDNKDYAILAIYIVNSTINSAKYLLKVGNTKSGRVVDKAIWSVGVWFYDRLPDGYRQLLNTAELYNSGSHTKQFIEIIKKIR